MSSPSYKTRLDRDAKAVIRGWVLEREERIQVWTRLLVELPSDPDRHLTELVRLPNRWAYRFTLGQRPNRRVFISAWTATTTSGSCGSSRLR